MKYHNALLSLLGVMSLIALGMGWKLMSVFVPINQESVQQLSKLSVLISEEREVSHEKRIRHAH